MISVTESAMEQLKSLCTSNNKWAVKLAVKGGGCAGFQYDWSFVDKNEELDPIDEIIPIDDNNVLILDGPSIMFIAGTELDYKKEIFGSSFSLSNPNVQSKCGCGTSFSA